jgi:2,4-didehydro-3-deoxy-L-rhamnonate hydrolase
MRVVRYRAIREGGAGDTGRLDVPSLPRLGLQFDQGPDGRGGWVVPLDALPGVNDDSDRSRALGDGDLAAYLAADVDLVAVRSCLERLPDVSPSRLPAASVRLLAPVHRPGKIVCVGYNYRDHTSEHDRASTQARPEPDRPLLFAKWANAVVGDGDPVIHPDTTHALDLEAELAIVIGARARRVPESLALAHVAGWTAVNDVTARDLQGMEPALRPGEHGDGQWVRAKSSDTFLPMGPAMVTVDEMPDTSNLAIRSWRTRTIGEPVQMQDGRSGNMIFDVPRLIAFVSESVTLEPGDIIATGTPSGVGVFRDPPVFLAPGDVVSVDVSGIGRLDNPVVAADGSVPHGSPAAAILMSAR